METRQERRIQRSMEQLTSLRGQLEVLTQRKAKAIPPHIRKRLDALDEKYAPLFEEVSRNIQHAEETVRNEVLEFGSTVKHAGLMAVYNKSHITWNTEQLNGYALAHPEILVCKKDSGPNVSIRKEQ